MQINGIYSLKNKTNTFLSCDAQHYLDQDIEIYAICTSNKNFAILLADLYKRYGVCATDCIDEMFLATVFDFRDNSIHIFADVTTSGLNMYYVEKDDNLYYSTSLKLLLLESKLERRMNLRAAKAFVKNGYIFGSETLIENVNKMQFGHEITVENDLVTQKKCKYSLKKQKIKNAKSNLIQTMKNSIEACVDLDKEIFVPLSGGFDSNFIINTVRQLNDKKINAITVGGKKGKSEVGKVKQNVSYLSNVELYEAIVDESYYDNFSDIVWRLEGSVFESGVFLQYALARCAHEHGAKYLICGEGSDEVQSRYYEDSLTRVMNNGVRPNEKFFTYADPFIGTNMLILKKSSLMLNSFGIEGRYPFKDARVADVAMSMARLNGTDKKYYKKKCKEELLPQIYKNLKTTGGTTGNVSAVSEEQLRELEDILSRNKLVSKIMSYDYSICIPKRTKKLRRRQYIERGISEIKEKGLVQGIKRGRRHGENQSVALLFKQAYLIIFEELFVSGKYDDRFNDSAVPVTTSQIIRRVSL